VAGHFSGRFHVVESEYRHGVANVKR
jgi:hypothetical protein